MPNQTFHLPVVQTNYARILVEVFADYGLDKHKLLHDSGLPADLFQTDSDFIPSESIKRLIHLTSTQFGVTKFTDLLGFVFRRRIIPNVLHQFTQFPTIHDAMQHINDIFSLDSPGSLVTFETVHDHSWFCRFSEERDTQVSDWSETFAVIYIIELIRILTNSSWTPTKIRLQSHCGDVVKSALPNSCQIFIGQEKTGVLLPKSVLNTPIQITESQLSEQPKKIQWHTSFTDSVFELLRPYVRERNLSIDDAAHILNYSVRTFQRKLQNESTSFRHVKESLMFSVSCELMEEGHSLTYISNQLGYTSISHFSRAFKRVSGLSPKVYKQSIALNASGA
ncbi:helix-turn-helix domain-containing protein [Vibrio alfacsensis]|uniref:helix-turn-helix domain-containing protein n=1 Tax=Vibrio alfacsensis TaxID=1074311 RepID=UPI001C826FF2|nr:AraC family transcriptional regulator [Vibrio alfacsensis]